jgi:hypothetical protein
MDKFRWNAVNNKRSDGGLLTAGTSNPEALYVLRKTVLFFKHNIRTSTMNLNTYFTIDNHVSETTSQSPLISVNDLYDTFAFHSS